MNPGEEMLVFDILVNEEGDVLIALDTRDSEPDHAVLSIQGRDVYLIRNEKDRLHLPELSDELISIMSGRDDVIVAETGESSIDREYLAEVMVS